MEPKVIAVIRREEELSGVEVRLVPQEQVVKVNGAIDFERTPYTAIQETRTASGDPVLVITDHRV
jgi:hypothetical protein